MTKLTLAFFATLLVAVLVGCSSSKVVPTTPHSPTTPETVKIYQEAPKEYQMLKRIEIPVTEGIRWDDKGDSVKGFAEMKAQAAALGANGVLLWARPDEQSFTATVGDGTQYYEVPMKLPRTAVVWAIYVLEP